MRLNPRVNQVFWPAPSLTTTENVLHSLPLQGSCGAQNGPPKDHPIFRSRCICHRFGAGTWIFCAFGWHMLPHLGSFIRLGLTQLYTKPLICLLADPPLQFGVCAPSQCGRHGRSGSRQIKVFVRCHRGEGKCTKPPNLARFPKYLKSPRK